MSNIYEVQRYEGDDEDSAWNTIWIGDDLLQALGAMAEAKRESDNVLCLIDRSANV